VRKIAISCIVLAFVIGLILIHARRQERSVGFRVTVSAVDMEAGVKLPVEVRISKDGKFIPLANVVTSYSGQSLRHEWLDSTQREVFVSSEGYCTQSFIVVGNTNITAILLKL